jgi:hypothetical protein
MCDTRAPNNNKSDRDESETDGNDDYVVVDNFFHEIDFITFGTFGDASDLDSPDPHSISISPWV